jgi:hypothetical protein
VRISCAAPTASSAPAAGVLLRQLVLAMLLTSAAIRAVLLACRFSLGVRSPGKSPALLVAAFARALEADFGVGVKPQHALPPVAPEAPGPPARPCRPRLDGQLGELVCGGHKKGAKSLI